MRNQTISIFTVFMIVLFSLFITQLSLAYVHPRDCRSTCDDPIQAPCPQGACRIGEQRAGFPFPVIKDQGGGSPTSGWGKIGPEDAFPPDFLGLLENILVYSLLLAFCWETVRLARNQISLRSLLIKSPLLMIGLGALIYGFVRDSSTPQFSPGDIGEPVSAILGNWDGIDTADGSRVIFRFYDSGRFSIIHTGNDTIWGYYSWLNEHAIQIKAGSSSFPPNEFCSRILKFLQAYCTTQTVEPFDPSAYPGPSEPLQSAYPVPTEAPQEGASLDAFFSIDIQGNKLTLTPLSGSPLEFNRIIN